MSGVGFDFKGLTVERINKYVDDIKQLVTPVLDNIASLEEISTYENTIQPMILVYTFIEARKSSFVFAKNFYSNKAVRDAGAAASADIEKFLIDCQQRKDVYEVINAYYENYYKEEKSTLTHEEVRYLEHTLRDFKRAGLHLDDQEYIDMKKELSDLCVAFGKNINEESTSFMFTKEQLDGMPDSWFTDNKRAEEDKWKMTLKYPDYMPAMQYIKDGTVRKTLHAAFNNRCGTENVPLFERAINLRSRMAKKLGYKTHADYKTEVKIVKTGQNALDFLSNLNKLFTPLYDSDMDKLTTFAKQQHGLAKEKLDPWDIMYYSRIYKEHLCDIDLEQVSKYFPLETVRDELFDIYQHLLGLKFEEVETTNKWHSSVKLFSVQDKESDELLGYFYLDMYPRDGKYSHAAAFNFISGHDLLKITGENRRQPHVMTMVCNFPEKECLQFKNVITFFHEFGHIMHQICSKPQLAEFCGFGVEWDFVEAPSQNLEQWCYCNEPLMKMSKHIETGEHVPKDIIEKLKHIKNVLNGFHYKRQIMYGLFDLKAHVLDLEGDDTVDSQTLWYNNELEVMGHVSEERYNRVAAFGHLMSEYDSGYYGYLRAETYAVNMFYKVFKNGHVMDSEAGMRYRKLLLQPGSTQDGLDLLRSFLGEEPDDKYFLIDKGL